MDELTQVKAELKKLQMKYTSAMQTIGSNSAQAADQVFGLAADLAIAKEQIEAMTPTTAQSGS